MDQSHFSFTRTIALLLLAGFACLGTSCNREQVPTIPASKQVPKVLRLYSWSDYFAPDVLSAFEEKTGIKVEYLTFSETDELEAKLKSQPGYYDVVVADDSILEKLWELRLLRELDRAHVPNLANIDSRFLHLPFDPENRFSAPYLWGTTLIAYRTDKIEDPKQSWELLWDPSLKGEVMVMMDRLETISVALMTLGYSLNTENAEHIAQATDKTIEQLETVDARYGDDAEVREALEAGTVAAAMCYSGDAAMVAAENENVAFFIPSEGAPLWIDSFAVVRDTQFPDQAHALIDYMLEAQVAAANSNYTYYASPNKAAAGFIEPELLGDETINPPADILAKCAFFEKMTKQREELLNRAWLKVQQLMQERKFAGSTSAADAETPASPKETD